MPGNIGKYKIIKTLGEGASCKVKLAQDTGNGEHVALKIMKDDLEAGIEELVMTEIKAMEKLKHENVVQIMEYGTEDYKLRNGKKKEVSFIAFELCKGGDLLDFIDQTQKFDEPLSRFYFQQFISGLHYCHENGISHRDLKPENLLLDANFQLKIADFGFAGPISGRDGKGYLETRLGTLNYMAPEIHLSQVYKGEVVDIFSAGIILFIMITGHPPFSTATPQDPFYKVLAQKKFEMFWKAHGQTKEGGENFCSPEFKDLVQRMLDLNPADRPTMEEIIAHPWVTAKSITEEELMAEINGRKAMKRDALEHQLEEKKKSKDDKISTIKAAMRSGSSIVLDDEDLKVDLEKPKKTIEDYEKVFS